MALSDADVTAVTAAIEGANFLSLDATYEPAPGANDGGQVIAELTTAQGAHQISFAYGAGIPEMAALSDLMAKLAEKIPAQ